MLDLGSGILHHDYPDWRRNTWLAGFYKLQDVLEAWRAQPARQNPVPRFEPGEPRHRMERFLSDLVGVLRERFGMYERPPESNDDQTGGAWLPTTWGQHYATVLGISRHLMYRRLLQDDEDENVIAELRRHLDMAAHLLRNMWNNEWLVQESVANRWRLQRLEVLVASWRREGGGAALPRFARDDEVMMLMILDGLTTAMRRRYLETDQRAEEEAAAYGGESGAGDLVLGRPADVAPLETAMSEGPGLNRRLVRSSSFSPPPEHRQEELEDDLVDVASDGASLGDSSDGREAELLGLATSDTSD